jgi:hypothetical protein
MKYIVKGIILSLLSAQGIYFVAGVNVGITIYSVYLGDATSATVTGVLALVVYGYAFYVDITTTARMARTLFMLGAASATRHDAHEESEREKVARIVSAIINKAKEA